MTTDLQELTLDVSQKIEIDALPNEVFEGLIRRLGSENSTPDGQSMPMVIETWPGGRWFRDLGDQQGHLWGFVQVIKPPVLLELNGPMFMSYAAICHLQFRVSESAGGSELSVRNRIIGMMPEEHRRGLDNGWSHMLQSVKSACEA